MMIVAVVIALSMVLSSAHPIAKSSIQCRATYNAAPKSCQSAYTALHMGNPTAEQRTMVYSVNQPCFSHLQNIARDCGNAVSI